MNETPVFSRCAVAAPHALAAEAGRAILAEGGNAIEAMVAMAAAIAVLYPHMNSIGGDGFWLIGEPGGRVRAIEACGYAGRGATIERYRQLGGAIPARGADAALTVPGARIVPKLRRETADFRPPRNSDRSRARGLSGFAMRGAHDSQRRRGIEESVGLRRDVPR
jgi:hypothetical protein